MDDQIEFVTSERWVDVIPEPVPAHQEMPSWFTNLPLESHGGNKRIELNKSTVKACISFVEAMKTGWIFKTPCDIELHVRDDKIKANWNISSDAISSFSQEQFGDTFQHDGPILKFHNLWRVEAPDGYSMLFTHPMNRHTEDRFRAASGIISIDNYAKEIHHPAFWIGGDFDGIIPKGTPISQGIPFKRDSMANEAAVRAATDEEEKELNKQHALKDSNQRSYRDNHWEPVDASKNWRKDDNN